MHVLCAGQCPEEPEVAAMLWMACHDPVPVNTDAALLVWSTAGCVLSTECVRPLMELLGERAADVRVAAADALATSLQVGSVICFWRHLVRVAVPVHGSRGSTMMYLLHGQLGDLGVVRAAAVSEHLLVWDAIEHCHSRCR